MKIQKFAKTHKSILGLSILAITIAVTSSLKANEEKTESVALKGDFIKGAQVWASTCARCHNLRSPEEFNDEHWKLAMMHMRTRAGLTGQDTRDVLAFLQASNKD